MLHCFVQGRFSQLEHDAYLYFHRDTLAESQTEYGRVQILTRCTTISPFYGQFYVSRVDMLITFTVLPCDQRSNLTTYRSSVKDIGVDGDRTLLAAC